MVIRDLELRDLITLEAIHKGRYPLPLLGNKLYPVQKIAEKDGKLLGSAYLHLTSEVSLIIDPSICNIMKARLIKEIVPELLSAGKDQGLQDTHVFVTEDSPEGYADFLKKHFGFIDASGKVLYLGV